MNTPEREKGMKLLEQQKHLQLASEARQHYRDCQGEAKQCKSVHLSFDFAQQVHYPSNPLQPGPMYFKTARKCALFGVANEGTGNQATYAIDEAMVSTKGANSVISYLHHYLENNELDSSKPLVLHADNCCGQNKNNFMIQYLSWRVCTGRTRNNIELNFMLAGHTKFAPDQHFGTIKRLYKRTYVSSLLEIGETIENSACNNSAVVLGDGSHGTTIVPMFDWAAFLGEHYNRVNNILTFQQFKFDSLGNVTSFKFADIQPTAAVQMVKKQLPHATSLPTVIPTAGLSLKRQWYLYESIREFCKEECMDSVCPKPSRPKSSIPDDTATPIASPPTTASSAPATKKSRSSKK